MSPTVLRYVNVNQLYSASVICQYAKLTYVEMLGVESNIFFPRSVAAVVRCRRAWSRHVWRVCITDSSFSKTVVQPEVASIFSLCLAFLRYVFRLATRNPDVQWNRTANPRPWDEWDGKRYKVCFLSTSIATNYRYECASKKVGVGKGQCSKWIEGFAMSNKRIGINIVPVTVCQGNYRQSLTLDLLETLDLFFRMACYQ